MKLEFNLIILAETLSKPVKFVFEQTQLIVCSTDPSLILLTSKVSLIGVH